ncbi:terpene synthase family protein [Xylaria cf. heliscus]|nr:terpene synthase family protein [Xylaria cf. heliscus]
MKTNQELNEAARSLIRGAVGRYDSDYGFGAMSCAVYDTAWVSLITKVINGENQWLFPDSFRYILKHQIPGGGWNLTASQVDGILDTAASLLSLVKHARNRLQICDFPEEEVQRRIQDASASLRAQLATWDVPATSHVGFEIIVPALLAQLENEGFSFEFHGKDDLLLLQATKFKNFKPEYLYGNHKSTVVHSLEAFIGKVDFDRLAHHKVRGSMLASPSSTAAYLINTSTWDDEAEAYIRHVVNSAPHHDGGVPSAYPSTFFEYSWMLSTLMRAGFSHSDLKCTELDSLVQVLDEAFLKHGGVIGFAAELDPDTDDTAKAILARNLLSRNYSEVPSLDQMICTFEAETHFRTYSSERDPSFSANCNVLQTLVRHPQRDLYSDQIQKATRFLCDKWWCTDGFLQDKWNISYLYPTMLLVEAFTDLLALIDENTIPDLLTDDLKSRACITVFQACLRTILAQDKSGSWEESVEKTAYATIVLAEARRLCFFEDIDDTIEAALANATQFLTEVAAERPLDYLWIEKVTYRSPVLTDSYFLAALKASLGSGNHARVGSRSWGPKAKNQMASYVALFRATPLFSNIALWELRASFIEATLFQPMLESLRLETFPREGMEVDKYFGIIPFTWTASNNRSRTFLSTTIIYKMMILSFLNYQADEYMEVVAGPKYRNNLHDLRAIIYQLLADDTQIESSDEPLARFITHVLTDKSVTSASSTDKSIVKRQLRIFLLSHVIQSEDNAKFETQQNMATFEKPSGTYFDWVRTTSADHTSCPYSFSYLACLVSSMLSPGQDCFPTATQKYLAEAACRHLATMCRMYNDYGSIERDHDERNLNSVNFPDFNITELSATLNTDSVMNRKKTLFQLAEYERNALNEALRLLDREADSPGLSTAVAKLEKRKMAIWHMFVNLTDLYGQIYVVRDIASRTKPMTNGTSHISVTAS